MTQIEKKFMINLQGKDFVLHEGLLDAFHQNGGKEIRTELLSKDPWLFKATVVGEKGTYTGHGDASKENVNSAIARHIPRMAETRAINRALRFYNNIGMCSYEELGEGVTDTPSYGEPSREAPKTTRNEIELPDGRKLVTGISKKNNRRYYGIKDGTEIKFIKEDEYNDLMPTPALDKPDF